MTGRVGFRRMLRAGVRAVSEYTGTFFGLFLVQLMVAAGAGVVIWQLLASQFARYPRFDQGVDGDLNALIESLRHAGATVRAIGWVGFGALALWAMLSWFLAGGLIEVLAARPQGRRDTARAFGAGGATTFFVFARLGALSLVGHVAVLVLAAVGLDAVYDRIAHALTITEVVVALAAGLAPAVLLMLVVWTIVDHARVELVLRRPTHERLGAVAAFARATAFVVRRPVALLHVLAWAGAFVLVSALYVWFGHGHEAAGRSGAIALATIREGVALVRMALKMALVGGQVELGATRPPPPRPPERAARAPARA